MQAGFRSRHITTASITAVCRNATQAANLIQIELLVTGHRIKPPRSGLSGKRCWKKFGADKSSVAGKPHLNPRRLKSNRDDDDDGFENWKRGFFPFQISPPIHLATHKLALKTFMRCPFPEGFGQVSKAILRTGEMLL